MDEWLGQLKWNAFAYGIVAAGALLGLAFLFVLAPALRRRWLPIARLRPGAWTGRDVLLAFCVFYGFPLLIVTVLQELGFFAVLLGPAPDRDSKLTELSVYAMRCAYLSSPLTLVVVLGMILAMLYARSGSRPHHYGLTWARWPANVAWGLIAFVLGRPLVIGIYALAVLVDPPKADPFEALARLDLPIWEWALFAFQTTVMSPILEELTCRGLLQGWLRRAGLVGHLVFLFLTLLFIAFFGAADMIRKDPETGALSYHFGPSIFAVLLALVYGFLLVRLAWRFDLTEPEIIVWRTMPRPAHETEPTDSTDASQTDGISSRGAVEAALERDERRAGQWAHANARLAIIGSAMLFAALHTNWPAPIALFPMGLILGWLAYRTQSLIAPIVFHVAFNLTTFIALYGYVLAG